MLEVPQVRESAGHRRAGNPLHARLLNRPLNLLLPCSYLNDQPFSTAFRQAVAAATQAPVLFGLVPSEHWWAAAAGRPVCAWPADPRASPASAAALAGCAVHAGRWCCASSLRFAALTAVLSSASCRSYPPHINRTRAAEARADAKERMPYGGSESYRFMCRQAAVVAQLLWLERGWRQGGRACRAARMPSNMACA